MKALEPIASQPALTIHENDWFAVRNRGSYYTIEYHLPQVAVLPVVNGNSIILVRVRRPIVGDDPLEIPAGCAEEGETLLAGAAREFAEETGIVVGDLNRFVPMPSLSVSPNRFPQPVHIFRIDISEQEYEDRKPHDDEIVSVERVSFAEAAQMIVNGKIYVSLVIAVIGTYLFSKGCLPGLLPAHEDPRK
jgi:8-oxo-dGTP pyrophosphatase MutT (NUDIX family)